VRQRGWAFIRSDVLGTGDKRLGTGKTLGMPLDARVTSRGFVVSPSPQSLVPSPEFAEHRCESRGVSPERREEFLIGALDEMDELASEAATRRRRAKRVRARVGRVIGATHELLALECTEYLRRGHGVRARVACEHDLCHGLVLLCERCHAREEHHLEMREPGIAERATLPTLPAIHGLPEENAWARGGRGELWWETFRHRRGAKRYYTAHLS